MELTDISLMPFGKYKGKKMQDVPASYLYWLEKQWNGVLHSKQQAVQDYINENRDVLEKELNDE